MPDNDPSRSRRRRERLQQEAERAESNARNPGGEADFFAIGELAKELNVTTRAIRFYESKGLLTPQRVGTSRVYSHRDRGRLMLILRGKRLGFTLDEIKEYLELYKDQPDNATQIRHLLAKVEASRDDLARKLEDIRNTLDELDSIRQQCIDSLRGGGGG